MNKVIPVLVILAVLVYSGFRVGTWWAARRTGNVPSGTLRHRAGWNLCIVGSLSLLVSVGSWIYFLHFTHVAIRTSGTVVEMRKQTDNNGNIFYAPTFRFQDSAGVQHTISSAVGESPPAYHVGDKVSVLYIGSDPQAARIDSFWQIWALPILAAIGSGIFLSVGVILIYWPKITGSLRGQMPQAPAA
jgi:Protein of unknown function (DUF3592)